MSDKAKVAAAAPKAKKAPGKGAKAHAKGAKGAKVAKTPKVKKHHPPGWLRPRGHVTRKMPRLYVRAVFTGYKRYYFHTLLFTPVQFHAISILLSLLSIIKQFPMSKTHL